MIVAFFPVKNILLEFKRPLSSIDVDVQRAIHRFHHINSYEIDCDNPKETKLGK